MAFDFTIASKEDVNRARVSVKAWNAGKKDLLYAAASFLDQIKSQLPQQISSGRMGYFALEETTARVKVNHFISSRLPNDNMFYSELGKSNIEDWREGIKKSIEAQENWNSSWQKYLKMFSAFGFGSAGSSATYSAAASTAVAESMQCLACAARQVLNSDLDAEIFADVVMGTHPKINQIRSFVRLDASMLGDGFPSIQNFYEETDGGPDWVLSSAKIANVLKSKYLHSGNYYFYRQDMYGSFKGNYAKVRNKIKTGKKSTKIIQKIFKGAGLADDKWNPADIIAVKTSFDSKKDYDINSGPGHALKADLKNITTGDVNTYKDVALLYDYNKWIHDNYLNGNIIPISLKKAGTTIKHELIDNADVGKINYYNQLDVAVTNVDYKVAAEKCVINFTVGGVDSGWNLDARGFEESGKIADIQIQLMQTGSTAGHGKVTLPVTTMIAKLSRGRGHFSKLSLLRKKHFPGQSFKMGFMDYRDIQGYTRTVGQLLENQTKFANYIEELSGGAHSSSLILETLNGFISSGNVLKSQKYIKNKVQSYEVGFMLDNASSHLKDEIKKSILKSMYLYASSKGFYIFENKKVISFLQSSTYVKVGG